MKYRDSDFLKQHIKDIADFYYPVCLDTKYGGYINQLRDDGTVFDGDTKHLVGTCRFISNFSIAARALKSDKYLEAAKHGLRFLRDFHRQRDGGYAWLLSGQKVMDGTRFCYGHAFVLLAASGAAKAEVSGAGDLIYETYDLLERRFWQEIHQLYVDEIEKSDWANIAPYRGQNSNMHMCEAMLSAYEATQDSLFLDRALLLARRICVDLAEKSEGLVWEHFRTDWSHDWKYNINNPKDLFKPYGYLPGHFAEWCKLLLVLERYRPQDWMAQSAKSLFDTAMEKAWDSLNNGMHYTFAPDGTILDTDRYYWVFAETFAAAALLALRTGENVYWDWYDRVWQFSDEYFVDHEHGGWYRILDINNRRLSEEKSPPGKTDYHPISACWEVLTALRIRT